MMGHDLIKTLWGGALVVIVVLVAIAMFKRMSASEDGRRTAHATAHAAPAHGSGRPWWIPRVPDHFNWKTPFELVFGVYGAVILALIMTVWLFRPFWNNLLHPDEPVFHIGSPPHMAAPGSTRGPSSSATDSTAMPTAQRPAYEHVPATGHSAGFLYPPGATLCNVLPSGVTTEYHGTNTVDLTNTDWRPADTALTNGARYTSGNGTAADVQYYFVHKGSGC